MELKNRFAMAPMGLLGFSDAPIQHHWSEVICRAMTVEEIHATVRSMGDSAVLAQRAGFDGVQIHAVHEGYLLDQFATSFYNQRTDEYGGSLDNRLRFAREIVDEIKERCGADYPVTLRFSPKSFVKDWREGGLPGEDFVEKGRDLPEGLEAARLFEEYGYDALDIDVGTYDCWFWNHPPMYQKKGLYVPFAKAERCGRHHGHLRRPDGRPGHRTRGSRGRRDGPRLARPPTARRRRLRQQAAQRAPEPDPPVPLLPGGVHGPDRSVRRHQLRGQPPVRTRGRVAPAPGAPGQERDDRRRRSRRL
ncbi:hypothetical protein [Cryobacterium sp. GrIS_2_6]|uniref:oxidoreductase n=1 Tax=Cryobacterium sp. GrIS_2_6 TaxID=3162785 RepID=UPI002E06E8E6|nr:hypothetical protein [Cryobacterium psychrotolerans]